MPANCTCGHAWAVHDIAKNKARTRCLHADGPSGAQCPCKAYEAKEQTVTTPIDLAPTDDDLALLPWRVGRKLGRTLYAVTGDDDDTGDGRNDILLGMMDSPELAAIVVGEHNDWLAATE